MRRTSGAAERDLAALLVLLAALAARGEDFTVPTTISKEAQAAYDEEARTVTFRWRDYANGSAVKLQTLPVDEFLRRFRRHLLPRGFTKVRHYGLLANNARKALIPQARAGDAERLNQRINQIRL